MLDFYDGYSVSHDAHFPPAEDLPIDTGHDVSSHRHHVMRTALSSAERREVVRIMASGLSAEFLVEQARWAIRANKTMREWRMLPADVPRLIEAHGIQDARWFAAEVYVWHGGWGLKELEKSAENAKARGVEPW